MKVLIKRFIDGKTWFDEFDVEYKNDETILELLDKIKAIDRSVTYRSFCRSSICGTCAIKVNNKTILACKSKVKDFVENDELIIEPLDRVKLIKDLVVDNDIIEDRLKKNKTWFEFNGNYLQKPQDLQKIEKQTDCILCMACFAECEALDYDKDIGGSFTKVYRFFFDTN